MYKIFLFFVLVLFSNEKVLFVGDSLTAYQHGWQDVVSKNKEYESTNISVGGKQTDWMVGALCNNLKKRNQYNKVFIYGGINDIFSSRKAEVPLANIHRMIDMCKKYSVEPIIVIGYDPSMITKTWVKDKKLEAQFRNEYKRYQDSLMVITSVKVIPPILLLRTDSDDGIHLNSAGHKKFSEWILKNMQ